MLAHKHISEIQVLDSVMAAIIARQLLAAFVIFIYNRRARLWKSKVRKQSATYPGSWEVFRTGTGPIL